MSPRRLAARPAILGLLLVLTVLVFDRALAAERVTSQPGAGGTVYRIDEPNVKQRVTPYPNIRFQPGDRVVVNAGGCVQTGGHGATWKRYVNPSGPDSDRLYHGLIEIPGATPGGSLVRIQSWIGRPLTIAGGVPPDQLYLRLGYEDDGYGDNGYYSHDDGTENQCKNIGAAWVTVTVQHGGPGTGVAPTAAPLDLTWTAVDDNGMPLNPRWGWQVTHPGSLPNAETQCWKLPGAFSNPQCSTQNPAKDEPSGWNGALCSGYALKNHRPMDGHLNWFAATYEGPVWWESHSTPGTDDDYNFTQAPPGQAGLMQQNGGTLGLEFDSDETIDHFNTPWWNAFHQAVDNNDSNAKALVDGRFAIVAGLVGLDCEHSCATELHPVYAMAIHVKDSPTDDVWAIFVRNSGNEGYCSQDQHYLDVSAFTFRLPWRPGATAVAVENATFLTNDQRVSGPAVSPTVNQGVRVTFTLPPPEAGARVNGELHLQWTGGQTAIMHALARPPVAAGAAQEERGTEEALAEMHKTLPPAQRQMLMAPRLAAGVTHDGVGLRFTQSAPQAMARVAPGPPRVRAVHDPRKLQKDQQRGAAVCAAHGGRLPDLPNVCASMPKPPGAP